MIRTDSTDKDFVELVRYLDADLAIRDGEEHAFYAQYNRIDKIRHVIVAYQDNFPVGCGAIKEYQNEIAEVKRMFVRPEFRGKGIAVLILNELEKWADELNFKQLILETGKAQPEAIALYTKCNYAVISNYGQYENVENSVCMKKELV